MAKQNAIFKKCNLPPTHKRTITTTEIQAYKVAALIKFIADNKDKFKATITLAAENVAERGINKCYYITNRSELT